MNTTGKELTFLLAPDKFKECLTADEVSDALGNGIHKVFRDARLLQCPVSDGGDGVLEILVKSTSTGLPASSRNGASTYA